MPIEKEALPTIRYRYIVTDLLTDEVIAEIPLTGVAYQRAVKTPGTLDATFSTIANKTLQNAYDDLTPGNTCLYVLRREGDGPEVCVWGGVITGRNYDAETRGMNLKAQDFLWLLYKRRIWKDWNKSYDAVVTFSLSESKVTLVEPDEDEPPTRQNTAGFLWAKPGTGVHIEWPPESPMRRFTGFYRISPTSTPNRTEILLDLPGVEADIIAYEYDPSGDAALLFTDSPHQLSVGDVIEIHGVEEFGGRREVIAVGGAGRYDQFSIAHTDNRALNEKNVTGVRLRRDSPHGVFGDATVSLHTDTFTYVRALIEHASLDFERLSLGKGAEMPGIAVDTRIRTYSRSRDVLTLRTELPHDASIGKVVTIRGLTPGLDGDHRVTDVLGEKELAIALKGPDINETSVPAKNMRVTGIRVDDDKIRFTTPAPHMLKAKDYVTVSAGLGLAQSQDLLTGNFQVYYTDSPTVFYVRAPKDRAEERIDIPYLPNPRVAGVEALSISPNPSATEVYLADSPPPGLTLGDEVAVSDIFRLVKIAQKSFSTKAGTAQIVTSTDHGLPTGAQVSIYGLKADMRAADISINGAGNAVTIKTDFPHPFREGQTVELIGFEHTSGIRQRGISGTTATLELAGGNNFAVGDKITVRALVDRPGLQSITIRGGVARAAFTSDHNIGLGDTITIKGAISTQRVVSVTVKNNDVILTLSGTHNFSVGDEVLVKDVTDTFDGEHTVQRVTTRTIQYHLDRRKKGVPDIAFLPATSYGGTVEAPETPVNGNHVVTAISGARALEFRLDAKDEGAFNLSKATLEGSSVLNGTWTITSKPTSTRIQFAVPAGTRALAFGNAPQPPKPEDGSVGPEPPTASSPAAYDGLRTISSVTPNTLTIPSPRTLNQEAYDRSRYGARIATDSFFNGQHTITVTSSRSFTFPKSGPVDLFESSAGDLAYLLHREVANGMHAIEAVDYTANSITLGAGASTWQTSFSLPRRGLVSSAPVLISNSYGPYAGNASFGFEFSTWAPSGRDAYPMIAAASEVVSVGELLDQYTDSIEGFEYRVDVDFDPEDGTFTRRFVFIEPKPSQSDRDWEQRDRKLVFEYPGNIANVSLTETADTSATRMFVLGRDGYGSEAGRRVVAATDEARLTGRDGFRPWPLLDDVETIPSVTNDQALYAYARRYLNESRPPDPAIQITLNGRMDPQVGSYTPGDWCDVVIDDAFIQQALRAGRDQRGDVITRKIDNYQVTVPDLGSVPEKVKITLVTEWEDLDDAE